MIMELAHRRYIMGCFFYKIFDLSPTGFYIPHDVSPPVGLLNLKEI